MSLTRLLRQIECYFGDVNLPKDKFLSGETKKADEWVTMEMMMKFKRLSELSSDAAVMVAAIEQSKAGLIQVSEDGAKIRRDPIIPLPDDTEESKKAIEARTAYVKGFDKNTSIDELMDHHQLLENNHVSASK